MSETAYRPWNSGYPCTITGCDNQAEWMLAGGIILCDIQTWNKNAIASKPD